MNCMHRFTLPVMLLMVLFLISCAGRPEQQLGEAQAAMDEASRERAPMFAKGDWDSAMEAWNEAQELLKQESYGKATVALTTARSRFDKAKEISVAQRERLHTEAEAKKEEIRIRYDQLKDTFAKARLSTSLRRDLDAAITGIDQSIEKMETLLKDEQYLEARDISQKIIADVYAAEVKLQGRL